MKNTKCLSCQSELEFTSNNSYARCINCKSIFMNMNNKLSYYPINEVTRSLIEQAIGFVPSELLQEKSGDLD